MALRALNRFLFALALLLCVAGTVQACFGPKLFVAAGQSPEEETLFALVTLYIEEKTGVESNRVIPETDTPLTLITADKADLVFAMPDTEHNASVFQLEGFPVLVSGERPLEDIQFTTVLPALQKLERLMTPADVMSLVEQVRAGKSAMATVRKYFMERRLI